MNTTVTLSPVTARFFNFAVAVLASPSAYSAVQVSKSSALVDAHDNGDTILFKSLVLAW